MKHFLHNSDLSRDELNQIIADAHQIKANKEQFESIAKGKTLALLFFNPSLRTQTSMQIAIWELGGNASVMQSGVNTWHIEHEIPSKMDGLAQEHIVDVVQVLGRYADAIGIRRFGFSDTASPAFEDTFFNVAKEYSPVPIINLESSVAHPNQALADRLTWEELHPDKKKRKIILRWAPHPKALPRAVPQSFVDIALRSGQDVHVVCPSEFRFTPNYDQYFSNLSKQNDCIFSYDNKIDDDADIVYVKSWHSLHHPMNAHKDQELRFENEDWMLDVDQLERASHAHLMHCLPVRRNVVATDAALDHPRSAIYQQAENRLHAQKALLKFILGL